MSANKGWDVDEGRLTKMVSDSCTCGMMSKSIEQQTLHDVQGSVKKVLKASSDVLVFRPGSTKVKKVYKPCEISTYSCEELDQQQGKGVASSGKGENMEPVSSSGGGSSGSPQESKNLTGMSRYEQRGGDEVLSGWTRTSIGVGG